MAKLEYSVDAKNVLTRFYRVDKMLYVEGDDDIPFWEFMFEKFEALNVEIQEVGGKDELSKYIEQISSGKLDAIVAMDSDYIPFDGAASNNKLVIRTAGHSIENTLISAKVLVKIARKIGRLAAKDLTLEECRDWLDDFYHRCSSLLINDLIDQCEGRKIGVVSDNCARFLKSKQSDKICPNKVEQYLQELGLDTEPQLSQNLETIKTEFDLQLNDFIRGHFLASAAQKFVSVLVQSKSTKSGLSNTAFFGAINLAFETVFDIDHPHFSHYEREFERLSLAA